MAAKVREDARVDALTGMKEEFSTYFEIIEAPARMLAGKTVPSLDPDKETEVLRDAADARDYQEAAKALLAKELGSRVQAGVQEQGEYLTVLSQSIDMLQQNPDLLRDRVFADRVAELIKPYEYRKDGKLYGYSVNVIPLVAQVRKQLATERGSSGAPAASAAPAKPTTPAAPAPGPQQGLRASAAQSSQPEGFDQLWSTLGFAPGTINL